MTATAEPLVHALYQTREYPAMSHPLADPAVSAVAARLGGLRPPNPRHARILEIGCASGHHLLPLAQRWPQSQCVGLDLAARAITAARDLATAAGIGNATFHAGDLQTFEPANGPFDFIIAHGFFSWVPEPVRRGLLEFCHRHLAATGIATISFNLTAGWAHRLPVIAMLRTLQAATGADVVATLTLLRETLDPATPYGTHLRWIIDDMLAKGPEILAFDDFAPVNEPWTFDQFLGAAATAGLRWLGESDPAENLPSALTPVARAALAPLARSPLHAQLAADFATGRTFRAGVLCRADAPTQAGLSHAMLCELAVRPGAVAPDGADPLAARFYQALAGFAPACVALPKVLALLPEADPAAVADLVLEGITRGLIRPRLEPVEFSARLPERPALNRLALACAGRQLPLVDIWQVPCTFPSGHYPILAAMDGSRSLAELAGLAADRCPELAFTPWLEHLAERGLFA